MDFAPSPRSDELKARLVELDNDIVRAGRSRCTASNAPNRAIRTSRRR